MGVQKTRLTPLALRYDEGATYTYIGEAEPGVPTTDDGWRIQRLTNADTTLVWAKLPSEITSSADFNKVWDNRASYTYE